VVWHHLTLARHGLVNRWHTWRHPFWQLEPVWRDHRCLRLEQRGRFFSDNQ
jgi:hypothetical protein